MIKMMLGRVAAAVSVARKAEETARTVMSSARSIVEPKWSLGEGGPESFWSATIIAGSGGQFTRVWLRRRFTPMLRFIAYRSIKRTRLDAGHRWNALHGNEL